MDALGPLMFVCVFVLIFAGYPVAFSLGGTALFFAFVGVAQGYFEWSLLYAFPERVFGVMSNYVLLAVPFFIFMGTMLGALEVGRGPLAHDRHPVRTDARWVGARGRVRRHAARGSDGRGGGLGRSDGHDLATDHAPLRLLGHALDGRDRGLGHARSNRPHRASC